MELELDSQATLKTDYQLVEDQWPIDKWHVPLFEDITIGKEQQFAGRFGGWENALGFGDFSQLAVIAFHRIGGVDQATDLSGIRKIGG